MIIVLAESEIKHSGLQVYLVNDDGDIIYSTITDENGYFSFTELPFSLNYRIKTEPVDNEDILLFLLGDDGKTVTELTSDNDYVFYYKKLSFADIDKLQLIYSVDSVGLVDGQYKKSLLGQMTYRNLPYKDGEGLRVYLLNKDGEVVFTTIADKNGLFSFKNLPYENSYTIMTEEFLPGVKLLITNEGNVVAVMKSDADGQYVYLKLPYMSAQDLSGMDISPRRNPKTSLDRCAQIGQNIAKHVRSHNGIKALQKFQRFLNIIGCPCCSALNGYNGPLTA